MKRIKQVTVTFESVNAAFIDDWENEITNALGQARRFLLSFDGKFGGDANKKLRDTNGNNIGTVSFVAEDEEDEEDEDEDEEDEDEDEDED